MGLPFEPEPTIALKARYPDALKDIFTAEEVAKNPSCSPSKKRKHVFDFQDGLRLVISTDQGDSEERVSAGAVRSTERIRTDGSALSALRRIAGANNISGRFRVTHYSASMYPTNPFNVVEFLNFVVSHINELRSKPMTGKVMSTVTEHGILHLFYDESAAGKTIDCRRN